MKRLNKNKKLILINKNLIKFFKKTKMKYKIFFKI